MRQPAHRVVGVVGLGRGVVHRIVWVVGRHLCGYSVVGVVAGLLGERTRATGGAHTGCHTTGCDDQGPVAHLVVGVLGGVVRDLSVGARCGGAVVVGHHHLDHFPACVHGQLRGAVVLVGGRRDQSVQCVGPTV